MKASWLHVMLATALFLLFTPGEDCPPRAKKRNVSPWWSATAPTRRCRGRVTASELGFSAVWQMRVIRPRGERVLFESRSPEGAQAPNRFTHAVFYRLADPKAAQLLSVLRDLYCPATRWQPRTHRC